MSKKERKVRIGIIGCGAIGSRLARALQKEFKAKAQLVALYDVAYEKAAALAKSLKAGSVVSDSLESALRHSDLVIEAVSGRVSKDIAKKALSAGCDILVMSVGGLLDADDVFRLAQRKQRKIYLPSGAIGGVDALKAAAAVCIDSVTLTTRKPPRALRGAPYIQKKNIDLDGIKGEEVIFDGTVRDAVAAFPENINVAATVALASGMKEKMRVQLITSPAYQGNSHEVCAQGEFGVMCFRLENVPCPDNPKTSYLAVLSAVATLRQILNPIKIGT